MTNDQFGYSKANQALWALPMSIIAMIAIKPFAGWYSDVCLNLRKWLRIVIVAMSAGLFYALYVVYHKYLPSNVRELPHLTIITVITILTALTAMCLIVPIMETMLDWTGREHSRAWISLFTVIKSLLLCIITFLWVHYCPHHIPPITGWLVIAVLAGTINSLIETMIAPMVYDYLHRSKLGTVAAGYGFFCSYLTVLGTNLGAWWCVFYTQHWNKAVFFHLNKDGSHNYDYSSLYLIQIAMFIPILLAKIYFIRLIITGRIKKAGVLEVEGPESIKDNTDQGLPPLTEQPA